MLNKPCKYCQEKMKTWSKWNDPIQCAFTTGVFTENNWNCWLMDILRDKAEKSEVYNDDMYAWLVPYEYWDPYWSNNYWFGYLYLEWYKSRWKTDKCINMETLKPLTLDNALSICSSQSQVR